MTDIYEKRMADLAALTLRDDAPPGAMFGGGQPDADETEIAECHATIADLRDRLRLFEEHVCRGCGCAVVEAANMKLCEDCDEVRYGPAPHALERYDDHDRGAIASACISVGLRAICGRRILEGVE